MSSVLMHGWFIFRLLAVIFFPQVVVVSVHVLNLIRRCTRKYSRTRTRLHMKRMQSLTMNFLTSTSRSTCTRYSIFTLLYIDSSSSVFIVASHAPAAPVFFSEYETNVIYNRESIIHLFIRIESLATNHEERFDFIESKSVSIGVRLYTDWVFIPSRPRSS